MNLRLRYQDKLSAIPPPGTGCHPALLSASNYGAMAGIAPQQIHNDLRRAIPQGKRQVSDNEISDAINKALSDHSGGTYIPRPQPTPVVHNGKGALQRIIDQGTICDAVDLWEASPIRLWEEPKDDTAFLLERLYDQTDLIWMGERFDNGIMGKTIRTAAEWIIYFRKSGKTAPHIIPNPMTGMEGTTKAGEPSFRSDNTINEYRYCLVEFDGLSREDQIRFWSAAHLPVVCLIDSGGKSIHSWLDAQKLAKVETFDEWSFGNII